MTQEIYRALVYQLCELVGLADPERVVTTGALCIDDFQLSLSYQELLNPNVLVIKVSVGMLDVTHAHQAYRSLLEANAVLAEFRGECLGLAPQGDVVILFAHLSLTLNTRAQDLADGLENAIAQAENLRDLLAPYMQASPPVSLQILVDD